MDNLHPVNYQLKLFPDLDTFIFKGDLSLFCKIDGTLNSIILHSMDIEVNQIELIVGGETFQPLKFSTDLESQELRIELGRDVSKEIVINMNYQGEINDKMVGFYRSNYAVNGEVRTCAVTQFQESDARRAFPCVDVPGKKATFDIEMTVPANLVAISNNAIKESIDLGDGMKRVVFKQTPIMSTYLVFFAYGEFEFIEIYSNQMPVRVYASPGKVQDGGQFGLDFGKKSLEYCLDYFQAEYPLPKLDLIATPDFAFGAMENYGAILFRETALLHNKGITSIAQETGIRMVIAHEIAHQWFGNLVSPAHWKYIWLNESFATYFAFTVVDHFLPENKIWQVFLNSQTTSALNRDAFTGTVPIELPGKDRVFMTPRSAPILYSKGSSILRQVANYLGHENFRNGLRSYLNRFKFGVAKSDDLWSELERVSGKPIQELMESWVLQRGYPVVNVKREGNKLTIAQKRFTFLSHNSETTWIIPIFVIQFYANKKPESHYHLMKSRTDAIPLDDDCVAYKINGGYTGFFHVHYDKQDLSKLGQMVENVSLKAIDRWSLEYDLYAFLRSNLVDLDTYLDFISHYNNEENHLAIRSIATHLSNMHRQAGDKQLNRIMEIGKEFVESVLKRIGIELQDGEDPNITSLRTVLISAGVRFESQWIIDYALSQFELLKNNQAVDANIMLSIYSIGARLTNDYDYFMHKFENAGSEREIQLAMSAIANFSDNDLITKVQELAFEKFPARNRHIIVIGLANNKYAKESLWHWYLANLDNFEALHPSIYQISLTSLIPECDLHEEDVKEFFKTYLEKNEKYVDAVEVALETMEINAQLRRQLS